MWDWGIVNRLLVTRSVMKNINNTTIRLQESLEKALSQLFPGLFRTNEHHYRILSNREDGKTPQAKTRDALKFRARIATSSSKAFLAAHSYTTSTKEHTSRALPSK